MLTVMILLTAMRAWAVPIADCPEGSAMAAAPVADSDIGAVPDACPAPRCGKVYRTDASGPNAPYDCICCDGNQELSLLPHLLDVEGGIAPNGWSGNSGVMRGYMCGCHAGEVYAARNYCSNPCPGNMVFKCSGASINPKPGDPLPSCSCVCPEEYALGSPGNCTAQCRFRFSVIDENFDTRLTPSQQLANQDDPVIRTSKGNTQVAELELTCLADVAKAAYSDWKIHVGDSGPGTNMLDDDLSDEAFASLLIKIWADSFHVAHPNVKSILEVPYSPYDSVWGSDLWETDWYGIPLYHFDQGAIGPRSDNKAAYFDKNCNAIDLKNDGSQVNCGRVDVHFFASPVSLLWTPGTDLKHSRAFTQFPLNPSEKGKWYHWRASKDAPLLVYDPKHTGKIRSAEQLFGNYTFGKQWKNGFEALGTLDTDHDGIIRGMELADLALWFDADEDGISDKNEVQPLSVLKVGALYFTPDKTDTEPGEDVVVSHGFDRAEGDTVISGGAVDWFSKIYASKEEARQAARDLFDADFGLSSETLHAELSNANVYAAKDPQSSKSGKDELSGVWLWQMVDASGRPAESESNPKGILRFETDSRGAVIGRSYLEVKLSGDPNGPTSAVYALPLQGQQSLEESGVLNVTFEVEGPDGQRTHTMAVIEPRSNRLRGTSSGNGPTTGAVEYKWEAVKLTGPAAIALK